ncbi:MAG TPA: LPS-assembly protein LptD [Steroidobacteraceae bacterium]|nr:LPS-assembly protein LptD [Steroidobacteraceae bacterium]
MARETSTATLLMLAIASFSPAVVHADETADGDDTVCPEPASADGTPPPAPGTEPVDDRVTIEADDKDFSFDANGNAVVSGNVVMRQGDKVIKADRLEYDAKNGRAKLTGAVEFSGPAFKVRGSSGAYSPALGAQFEGAQFELPQSNARGAARNMQVDANGTLTLEDVSFTTCPLTDRAWEIKSRRIVIDSRANTGTGHGTRVEFKDVPFVYLPWMTFPVGPQRKSGFFFPKIGGGSRNGAEISVPYYWNIRPNADLMAAPVYYAKRGVDFAGELRYLTRRQRGTLDFNYLPNDDIEQIDRHRIQLEHVAELPGDWRFRIDATDVGDSRYFEDFAHGPEGTSVPFTERLAEATFRDEHWNVRAQIQDFQTIDEDLPVDDRPYARTPRVLASGDWDLGLGAIDYGFDGEIVNFERNVGVTGWRMDVAPRVGFDWSAPGFFVRPSGGFRYTQYSLENNDPGTDDSPSRSLPFASLDAGLVFERAAGSRGQRRMTLEPRALYLYAPFREQSELPLFDTGLPDLNLVQLFRANRYVGADRVNDANQVSFGLTSRLFDADTGAQYLAASFGQAYYFEKPRVVLPDEPVATRDTSDFIAQVSLSAYKNWNVEAGLQWNPEDTRSERSQFRLQYRPAGDRVLNLSYRTQRDRLEQAELSGAWPIGKHWNAYARGVYSLRDSQMLERFAGFEYKACCWRLRAVARRSVSNREGTQETSFYLQLELKGLASVGDADAFLEHTIRGYSPETSAE